jgi:hypothetical protein
MFLSIVMVAGAVDRFFEIDFFIRILQAELKAENKSHQQLQT